MVKIPKYRAEVIVTLFEPVGNLSIRKFAITDNFPGIDRGYGVPVGRVFPPFVHSYTKIVKLVIGVNDIVVKIVLPVRIACPKGCVEVSFVSWVEVLQWTLILELLDNADFRLQEIVIAEMLQWPDVIGKSIVKGHGVGSSLIWIDALTRKWGGAVHRRSPKRVKAVEWVITCECK
jgi:hypothetical protein